MNKYELEKVLSKLDIVRELLFQHIPYIYTSNALEEVLKSIGENQERY